MLIASYSTTKQVMSTDDFDGVSTTDASPITTLKLSTMKPSTNEDTSDSQIPIEKVSIKGASQTSLSSLSELHDDSLKQSRFEVTSVDALSLEGDVGDKREHANSAFEIIGEVVDLDSSSAQSRLPTSADESFKNISKLESSSKEKAHTIKPIEGDFDSNADNGNSDKPGPSRFKRVNTYDRGRWTIKDMANTEESQKDSKNPQKLGQESPLNTLSLRKHNMSDYSDSLYAGSTSDLGTLTSGSGLLTDINYEKDSIIERSSTAAESGLSRKSSLSSIIPDDHFETESVASTSGSTAGKDRDTPETSQQQQQQQLIILAPTNTTSTSLPPSLVSQLISTSSVVMSTTQLKDHGPNCYCEPCTELREKEAPLSKESSQTLTGPASVKHAMSHLQSELDQLLRLNTNVDQKNSDLIEENKVLKAEVEKLKDENSKIQKELAKLKQALAIFVNTSTEPVPTGASNSNTS